MNGAGYNVSHAFGFGLMDAGAMVKLAKQWTTVQKQEVSLPDQVNFVGNQLS